jgi:hypothetical protein
VAAGDYGTVTEDTGADVTDGGSGRVTDDAEADITVGGSSTVTEDMTVGGSGGVTDDTGADVTDGGSGRVTADTGADVTDGGSGTVTVDTGADMTDGGSGTVTVDTGADMTDGGSGTVTVDTGADVTDGGSGTVTDDTGIAAGSGCTCNRDAGRDGGWAVHATEVITALFSIMNVAAKMSARFGRAILPLLMIELSPVACIGFLIAFGDIPAAVGTPKGFLSIGNTDLCVRTTFASSLVPFATGLALGEGDAAPATGLILVSACPDDFANAVAETTGDFISTDDARTLTGVEGAERTLFFSMSGFFSVFGFEGDVVAEAVTVTGAGGTATEVELTGIAIAAACPCVVIVPTEAIVVTVAA